MVSALILHPREIQALCNTYVLLLLYQGINIKYSCLFHVKYELHQYYTHLMVMVTAVQHTWQILLILPVPYHL